MSKDRDRANWARRVAESLRTRGYFYDLDFSSIVENADVVMLAARSLGSLFIPSKTDSSPTHDFDPPIGSSAKVASV